MKEKDKTTRGTVRTRVVGREVARVVADAGLTATEVAGRLEFSLTRMSRVFTGHGPMRSEDVAAVVAVCGISAQRRGEFVELARVANEVNWLHDHCAARGLTRRAVEGLEESAARIVSYDGVVLPLPLRTQDYARVVGLPAGAEVDVVERVFYLDEQVFARMDPVLIDEQVAHVLRCSGRAGVSVRVVPLSAGTHAGRESFRIIEPRRGEPVVHIEHRTSSVFLERPEAVAVYRAVVGDLMAVALSEEETGVLLTRWASGRRPVPAT